MHKIKIYSVLFLRKSLIILCVFLKSAFFLSSMFITSIQADVDTDSIFPATSQEKINSYWRDGNAEIASYQYRRVRYGVMRAGVAVNIFVSEDFLRKKQVKRESEGDGEFVTVLKLNGMREFVTGVYKYSTMLSLFTPLHNPTQILKANLSSQDWCGQSFLQYNLRSQRRSTYNISLHSYFEAIGDREFVIGAHHFEDNLFIRARLNPATLPLGDLAVLPSLEYLLLEKKSQKAYAAHADLLDARNFAKFDDLNIYKPNYAVYKLAYPGIGRNLALLIERNFPHKIEAWITWQSDNNEILTYAHSPKFMKIKYWQKNKLADEKLRSALDLK